jgi:hypothetical protein
MVTYPDRTAFFGNYFRIGGDSEVCSTLGLRGTDQASMSALAILCQSKVKGEFINTGEKQAKLSITSRKDGLPRIEIEFEPRIPVRSGLNKTEPHYGWCVLFLVSILCGTRRSFPRLRFPGARWPTFPSTSRLHVWRFIEVHDDAISASGPRHAGAGWETVSSC